MAEHSAHAGDGVSSIWRVRRFPGPVRSVGASRRSSRWLAKRYRRSGAPSSNRAALGACGRGPLLGANSVPGGAPLGAVVGRLRSQPVLAASGRGRVVLGGLTDPLLRTSRRRRSRRAAGRGPSGPAGGWSRPSLREELPRGPRAPSAVSSWNLSCGVAARRVRGGQALGACLEASSRQGRSVCVRDGAALGALAALYACWNRSGPGSALTVTVVPVMETSNIDPFWAITSWPRRSRCRGSAGSAGPGGGPSSSGACRVACGSAAAVRSVRACWGCRSIRWPPGASVPYVPLGVGAGAARSVARRPAGVRAGCVSQGGGASLFLRERDRGSGTARVSARRRLRRWAGWCGRGVRALLPLRRRRAPRTAIRIPRPSCAEVRAVHVAIAGAGRTLAAASEAPGALLPGAGSCTLSRCSQRARAGTVVHVPFVRAGCHLALARKPPAGGAGSARRAALRRRELSLGGAPGVRNGITSDS